MAKFKIGDKVRLGDSHPRFPGRDAVVTRVFPTGFIKVKVDGAEDIEVAERLISANAARSRNDILGRYKPGVRVDVELRTRPIVGKVMQYGGRPEVEYSPTTRTRFTGTLIKQNGDKWDIKSDSGEVYKSVSEADFGLSYNSVRSRNAVVQKALNARAVCNASYSTALKAIMDAVKPYMDRRITDDTSWRYPALVISKLRDVCERAVMSAGRYDGKRPPHRVYDVECVKDGFKFSGNLIVSGLLHRDDPDDVSAFDEYDMILSLGYAGKASNASRARNAKYKLSSKEAKAGDLVRVAGTLGTYVVTKVDGDWIEITDAEDGTPHGRVEARYATPVKG